LARETDLLRGHVLRLKGNYNAAIGPLRRAAFGLHQNVGAWLALGWCYRRIGRYAQAVAAAKRACSVQPRNIIAIYNLACYLCLAGRRDAALDAVRAALRREPKLREFLMRDPDFDKLRSDEAFQALLEPVCRGG
jgi:Flp pilus assembly protein TadD